MANTTITIYRADGAELMTAPVTDGAQLERKLMDRDEMTLSWVSAEAALIPMGAYAVCPLNGKRYHMADPYWPQQKDVGLYEYKPTFKAAVFLLDKVPLLLYTRDASGAVTGAECDWSFTGRGADLFAAMEAAISEGLGEDYEIAAEGEFEAALTLSFSNASVLSALNSVAEAWGAEWWYEDLVGGDGGRRITFGRMCARGAALPLTAGAEVECPQSNQKNTLYNRFYVFGGTRNIPQDYNGAQANSVVSKRLTLNPAKYPKGYIELPLFDADGNAAVDGDGNLVPDASAENAGRRFAKVLQFDDVYPRSDCRIKFGTLHSVQRYVRDSDDQKVMLADGTHDSWRLYAFALEYYDGTEGAWRDFRLNKTAYDKDSNPGGSLIKGLTLSLHFKSGALEGREFEATYHDAPRDFRSEDGSGGFTAGEGFFEVVHSEDNTVILPGPGIAPRAATTAEAHDGDEVVVFNIRMPRAYYEAAYAELEARAVEAIWDEVKDANEYTVKGNRVHFHDSDPGLAVGRLVRLTVGGRAIDTRVTALTTKIGAPYDQSVTFCKALAKGKISTLLTQVEAARQDVVEVAVADEARARASRQRLYAAQREMVEAMFDTDGYLTAPISPAAVETAVLKTGAASANFQLARVVFEANYNDGAAGVSRPDHFRSSAGTLIHYGLGGDAPREWDMAAADLSDELMDDAAPYYLYAKCADGGTAGVFTLSTEQVRFDARLRTEGCYYFLAGILSSVQSDGEGSFRVLNCTYGSTTVSGRFVRTGRIESVDGSTGMDLDKGEIFGNIRLAPSASDEANKAFIDSLLGYSADKASMEGGIASAKTAASAAKDKVDGLAVGGRNYLLRTAAAWGVTGKGAGASENYTVYNYKAASAAAFTKGATVTISFDYDNAVTGGAANILVHDMWRLLIALTPSNAGSGRFSATLTLGADVALSHPIYIQGKWDGGFTISNAKWEAGNVPTSWTPAPEDVDSAIGAAQTAADGARDAVDGMVVGGRNYILKTATPAAYKSVTTSQFVVRLGLISAGLAQRQVAMGESITVSFEFRTDGKVDGSGAQWVVINGSGQWRTLGYTPQFEDTGGAWVRRSHTWRWGDSFSQAIKDAPKDLAAGDEFVIGCNPSSSVVNIGIRRLKLEVGNKRTDWEPAPEDVDDAIEAAKKAAVEEVDVMYALGASATTAPTSGWQTTAPAWQAGKYMWQRTDITTGDGVLHTGTPTCIQGAAAAETGALPMIWAGADESSTKGVGAADFRVYKDGSIIMHSAQILGKAGEPAVTVSKGNISVGTMNAAADGLASVGTEIIPDSYASVADVLNGLAGGGGALSAGGTVNKTLELAYSQMTKMGLAAKRTSTTYTQVLYSGTTASTGTVWVGFTSGKYSLAGKVTANAGTGLGSASLSVFISVVLQVGDSKVTLASRDAMARLGNSTSSMTSNLAPAVSETGDLPTNVASLPFTKGQAWKVYVEAYWEAASLYYYAMPDNPFTVSTTPTAALTNAAIRISDVQAAYRNKIFRNGLVMSKSNANYLVVASDSSSPLLEARAGTSTTANAGVRLAAGGVQVNFNGTASSAWHEAFPLYAVVLVTFTTNVAGGCSFLYNPHNMPKPGWDREGTGIYTLSWDSPDTTLYPNFQAMTSTQRYVSVRSIAAKSITVGIGDDDTTNDMATGDKFLVFLYKF